jgi:hypothetical protein
VFRDVPAEFVVFAVAHFRRRPTYWLGDAARDASGGGRP